MKQKALWKIVWLFGLVLVVAGCSINGLATEKYEEGEQPTDTRDIQHLQADINMKAGVLSIQGQENAQVSHDLTYTPEVTEPNIEYSSENGAGYLGINQTMYKSDQGKINDNWDIHIDHKLPLKLSVNHVAGKADIHLGDLNITDFTFHIDAGQATLDYRGDWTSSVNTTIDGSVGDITIYVPSDVGVRIKATKTIGLIEAEGFTKNDQTYTNDKWGESEINLEMNVNLEVGSIKFIEE